MPGGLTSLQFSKNSKWLVYQNRTTAGGIIDFELFKETGNVKNDKYERKVGFIFNKDEKHYMFTSDIPDRNAYIMNYLTGDTIYYVNDITLGFGFNPVNNSFVGGFNGNKLMYGGNWYYSDVPDENVNTDLISNISYQNGTLKYSSLLENVQSIKITDLSGKVVFQNDSININNKINIVLTKGIYFIVLNDGKKEYSKKFMVME